MNSLKDTNYSINEPILCREGILNFIRLHWSNLTGCSIENFNTGITYILDSKNLKLLNTQKSHQSIQVLNYRNGGTIINLPDECYEELNLCIKEFGIDDIHISRLLQQKYNGTISIYSSVRSYLFTLDKLLPIDGHIRKLERSEKNLFETFLKGLSEYEKSEVYMDFNANFHNFYAYFIDNEIVALGEYCKIHEEDTIVVLSIITGKEYRGKGYGKSVVNAMTHKIIESGFIPQYRADPKNTASRKLAASLGYEEILDGFSITIL